ncbi:hypothetical protein CO608_08500 [Lysobacteraceae bacterium NML08-0793]|nr:hypothetical protein CO608_08500 [Xanthomonadaceae bacterium NML08-0793]
MYFASLLLALSPILLLAAVSIVWKQLTFAKRVLWFAVLPAAGYFGIAWWVARDIHQAVSPAGAAALPMMSPLQNAAGIGALALVAGVIAVSLAHLIARKGRATSPALAD